MGIICVALTASVNGASVGRDGVRVFPTFCFARVYAQIFITQRMRIVFNAIIKIIIGKCKMAVFRFLLSNISSSTHSLPPFLYLAADSFVPFSSVLVGVISSVRV